MLLLLTDGDDGGVGLDSVLCGLKGNNLPYQHETAGLEVDDAACRQFENTAAQSAGKCHSTTSANPSKVFSSAFDLMRMPEMLGKFRLTK